jgi:hypothetical protein
MEKPVRIVEVEALIREIQRYLVYVNAFRKSPGPTPDEQERREQ